MQIFALQTDRSKTTRELLAEGEEPIVTVRYSGFIYVLGIFFPLCITALLIAIGVILSMYTDFPPLWVWGSVSVIWIIFALMPILYKYLHWYYSFVLVTKERIVIVDQVSLVHRQVTELSLENFASVAAETQFWNIFPFGILHFTMREGNGKPLSLHYVPDVENIAKKISGVVTAFQSEG